MKDYFQLHWNIIKLSTSQCFVMKTLRVTGPILTGHVGQRNQNFPLDKENQFVVSNV